MPPGMIFDEFAQFLVCLDQILPVILSVHYKPPGSDQRNLLIKKKGFFAIKNIVLRKELSQGR